MALQGNPFFGKLKVPAPDLSRIPETPFDSTTTNPHSELAPIMKEPDRVQTGSEIGFKRVQTGSEIGFNTGSGTQIRASHEG